MAVPFFDDQQAPPQPQPTEDLVIDVTSCTPLNDDVNSDVD